MFYLCFGGTELALLAQVNSWIKPTSGYWEEPYWSLGILPGANQDIYLTNSGWKALGIRPNTAQNYAQTLNVGSVTVSAPIYSFNMLLMNYFGLNTPLVIGSENHPGSFIVASNSAVLMLYSAVRVNDFYGGFGSEVGAFSIGGTFSQTVFSQVYATFLHVGDIGPGVYNLTNGLVVVGTENVGGNFAATFNQFGGTNLSGLELFSGGQYHLYDGYLGTNVAIHDFAAFSQYGGTVFGNLDLFEGNYLLAGGTLLSSALNVPQFPTDADSENFGTFIQTGGTNLCSSVTLVGLDSDPFVAGGDYLLNNGALFSSGPLSVGALCNFTQQGGVQTNTGISISGGPGHGEPVPAFFQLKGGMISTLSLNIDAANFSQTGGTNQVAGDITCLDAYTFAEYYFLGAGLLSESNLTLMSGLAGGTFTQTGGVHLVTGLLSLIGDPFSRTHYALTGGALSAQNIQLASGASFQHLGGTVSNPGKLTLAVGTWYEQTAHQEFGQLQLGFAPQYSISSNSAIWFPTDPCTLHFTNSRSLAWTNGVFLIIEGWNGSIEGGGRHQLTFGSDATGLSPQQVSQIQFHNPMGVSGMYPATLLATGEIVPAQLLVAQNVGGNLVLSWGGDMILQSATNVSGPYEDVTGVSRPYAASRAQPQMFFRLRSP